MSKLAVTRGVVNAQSVLLFSVEFLYYLTSTTQPKEMYRVSSRTKSRPVDKKEADITSAS